MSIHPNLATSSQSPLYSEFLLHLEELPTPETIKKLQIRISQLEDRLLETNKQAHCRELEFHRLFNEKKGQWVLKYLELKSELANTKTFYEEKNNQWEQDASQLVKIIKFLTNACKQKEEQANTALKVLDSDFSLILSQSTSACNSHRAEFFTKGSLKIKGTPNTEEFVLGSNLSSPEFSSGYKRHGGGLISFQTPRMDLDKVEQHHRLHINTASTDYTKDGNLISPSNRFSSAFHSMLTDFQGKIQKYMTELSQNSVASQLVFEEELGQVMKNLSGEAVNHNNSHHQEEPSFARSEKKPDNNNSLSKSFNQSQWISEKKNKIFKKTEQKNQIFTIISNNVSARSHNESSVLRKDFDNYLNGMKEKSNANDSQPDIQSAPHNLIKKLELLQNSLNLSEREAVLCMLMDSLGANGKRNDVNFDDLLAATLPKDKNFTLSSNNMYPPSISKVPEHSISYAQGSHMKVNKAYYDSANNYSVGSPAIPHKFKQQATHNFAATPEVEKQDLINYLSRFVSPGPGFTMDVNNMQNVDLGSFTCAGGAGKNEQDFSQEFETPGMKDLKEMLAQEILSPIVPKENNAELQRQYGYLSSVEKEYGRKLGGALNFNDKFMDDYEMRFGEKMMLSEEDRKRLPTAEDTKYAEKVDEMEAHQEILKRVLGRDEDVKREATKKSKSIFSWKFCAANTKPGK